MANRQFVALGVIFAAFAAAPATAQPAAQPAQPAAAQPAAPAAPKAEKAAAAGERKPDKAEPKADKAAKAADKAEVKADKAADKAADRAGDKGAGRPDHAGHGHGDHAGPGHGHFRSGLHALFADFKDGKVKKEELKDKLAKLRENATQRRNEHREALKTRWGRALTLPAVREELRHHARRMAFLNRALFLVQTEMPAKDKVKLVARIEKLIDKESERHEKAMERFKSATPGAPGAPGAPAAAAPAAPGAPAAIPASDKKGAEK